MTDEERREMMRRNFAAQLEMMGYEPDGLPLPPKQAKAKALKPEEFEGTWYCKKCRSTINYQDKYCHECGNQVKWDE